MEYILIINSYGVMFAGNRLISHKESEWIGLKPSKKSEVCIFFHRDQIHTIYHENGNKEEFMAEQYNLQYTSSTNLSDQDIVLVRVKGGVSYRGQLIDNIEEEAGEGYWIAPVTNQRMCIYIPKEEVEEIFIL